MLLTTLRDFGCFHSRGFTGHTRDKNGAPDPSGCVFYAVTNAPILCKQEAKNPPVSVTVVSIPYVGFSQVPWKARKPNKAASNKGETPKTKPLYVACDYATDGATRERTIRTMSLYSFKKISAQEKGERNDGMVSLVSVGDTLLFHCSEYHFETKAKAEDECFPRELSVIPEFSMVAITVKASAEEGAASGYGMNMLKVRPLSPQLSLYSFLSPLGLHLLPSSYAKAQEQVGDSRCIETIRSVVERTNVGFFCKVRKGAQISAVPGTEPGSCYRLYGPLGEPLAEGLDAVDIPTEGMLAHTNSVDLAPDAANRFACLLVSLAASADALYVYVAHNEYRARKEPKHLTVKGVPVIDTESLLQFVTLAQEGGEPVDGGEEVGFKLPFHVPGLENSILHVRPTPIEPVESAVPRACQDLVLGSCGMQAERAYRFTLVTATGEERFRMLFAPKMAQAVSGAAVPIDFTTADFSSAAGEKRAAVVDPEVTKATGGKRAK